VKASRSDFIPLARIVADPVVLLVNEMTSSLTRRPRNSSRTSKSARIR